MSISENLSLATELLEEAQTVVDAGYRYLNEQCGTDGKFSSKRLDDHQLACYELAYASAELTAAKSGLDYAAKVRQQQADYSGALLEEACALVFSAEAVNNTRTRLSTRRQDFGTSTKLLDETLLSERTDQFCRMQLSADNLSQLGKRCLERPGFTGAYNLPDDKEMIRDTFHQFAYDVVKPLAEEIHTKDLIIPDEILNPLTELGVFGLSIPQKYGGLQPDDREDNLGMIVVTEELSRGSLGGAGSLITRPEIMARSLLKGGTDAQKSYWLPKLAVAEPLCAIAVTEPNYGSDVAQMRLKATKCDGGWLLSGEKTWCTFAGKAGVLLTLARTDPDLSKGHRGLTQFIVEKPSDNGHEFSHTQAEGGTISGKAIPTIGYRGMHSYNVFFDNYFVPDSHVVGEADGVGKGFYSTMAGFAGGRIQTAARASGVMQAAYEQAVTYAQERVVFGSPIADYQLTLVKIAKMATLIMVCRQFTYAVARLMDEKAGQMEASLVKLFACKSSEWICREAMQIHGGMGYAEESAVSRYFIDARVLSIFEGAEETLALKVISKALVEQAVSTNC